MKIQIWMAPLLFSLFLSGCIGGCGEDYSEGERTGIVWKLSNKGLFTKSWEGELNMGGFLPSGEAGAMVPNVWRFSAKDAAVIEKLREANRKAVRVTVKYRQWWIHPLSIDTEYIATDVVDLMATPEKPIERAPLVPEKPIERTPLVPEK